MTVARINRQDQEWAAKWWEERRQLDVQLQEWCGHAFVSLRTWLCPDCGRALPLDVKPRLETALPVAPPGSIWVATSARIHDDRNEAGGYVEGVYTDRSKIPRLLVRGLIADAASVREQLKRIHWYQGVYNPDLFEGWDEEPDARGQFHSYRLALEVIDSA